MMDWDVFHMCWQIFYFLWKTQDGFRICEVEDSGKKYGEEEETHFGLVWLSFNSWTDL